MNENKNAMTTPRTQSPAQQQGQAPAVRQENISEKFTAKVLKEFGSSVAGAMEVTEFQKKLIQGYFVVIDRALKAAEEERLRKNGQNSNHSYDNNLAVVWQNVNLNDLALDLVHYARMGLDMQQDNMLFPIPYKNNKANNYDVTLMEGYNGVKYIAKKYAVDVPVGETIELVYSTDTFVPYPKDSAHPVPTYEFTINNPFDRGEVIGGFGYLEFADASKNELIIMPLKAILKRKPAYASGNFWGGGTKTEWKTIDGKRQKVEVEQEGWFEEMCRKTLIREVYSAKHLPRDPQKIDDSYQFMKMREARYAEIQVQAEIDAEANTILIDTAKPAQLPAPAAEPYTIHQAPQLETIPVMTSENVDRQPTAQASLFDNPDF